MISTEEFTSRVAAHSASQQAARDAGVTRKRELRAHSALAGLTIEPDNDWTGHVKISDQGGQVLVSGDVEEVHRGLFPEQYRVGE